MPSFNHWTVALFLSIFCLMACSKEEGPTGEDPLAVQMNLDSPCRFSLTLGNEQLKEEETKVNEFVCGGYSSLSGFGSGLWDFTTSGSLLAYPSLFGLTVTRGTLRAREGDPIPEDDFAQLFAVGQYPITSNAENGFEIRFVDKNGTEWSSSYIGADQSNSQFEILEVVTGLVEIVEEEFTVKIKARYNCTLFDQAGESKESSGTMILAFQIRI